MGLYVGDTRVSPVLRVMPNFKGTYNLIDDLELTLDATEVQITTALTSAVNNPLRYDYCLVEKPWYQVHEGYASFTSVDDYVGYYVIYNNAYVLIDDSNKSSSGITVGTTVAYILNNAYSVVRYNFDGTDWTSADNSGYANVDASNFTDSGTTYLSKIGYMDWSRMENLPIPASGTTITAPANGWLWGCTYNNSSSVAVVIFERTDQFSYNLRVGNYTGNSGRVAFALLPIKQGEQVKIIWGSTNQYPALVFIYAEGTPTPPQP